MKKIIFVVNVDWFFVSHRLPLAEEALNKGWEVFLVTKFTDQQLTLSKMGIQCIPIDFERSGRNPFKEFKLIFLLKQVYNQIKPDIIHHVTLKPSLYGTLAAKHLKSARIINAVSGLGYSFTDQRKSWSTRIIMFLMKRAFKDKNANFIFQNPDDKAFYQSMGFLNERNFKIIKGSGVDELYFPYITPVEKERLVVVLLARMLKDKGVLEFVAAARFLKKEMEHKMQFLLVGGVDSYNPAHLTAQEMQALCDGDYIKWTGHTSDVKKVYENCDIVCLPSYREGLPKSLVEAMAIGRPIIATDTIGCRECVEDGINGFLVPVKESHELAEKIKLLALNKELRLKMGLQSREKMLAEMSLKQVIKQTFEFYEQQEHSRQKNFR